MSRLIVFAVCSLCIGFVSGVYFSEMNATSDMDGSEYSSNLNGNEVINTSMFPSTSLQGEISSIISSNPDDYDLQSISIEQWLADKPALSLKQISALISKISNMDEESAANALSHFNAIVVDPSAAIMRSMLVSRLVELDPLKAWDHVNNLNVDARAKQELRTTVISAWSRQSPMKAFEWYLDNEFQLKGSAEIRTLPALLLYEIAKKDVDSALQSVSLFSSEVSRTIAFSGIFAALQTPEQFIDALSNEQIDNDKDLEQNLIRIWTSKDSEAVKSWFESLIASARKDDIRFIIFHDYINSVPTEAASWFVKHSKPENYQSDVEHAATYLAYSDPEKALTWTKRQINIDINSAVESVLETAARHSPNFVEKNLDLVIDRDKKVAIALTIYAKYKNKSDQLATNFLDGFEFKEDLSKRITSLYSGLSKSN